MYKSRMNEKLKSFLVITGTVLILGGGVCALFYLMLESGYGACLIVHCVKILP